MSALYQDLPFTSFPGTLDTFTTWINILASDGLLIAQYQTALQAGNIAQANQILAQIPQGTQKIITATDLNKLTQAIQAVERFYKTDVKPYIQSQQESWLNIINQFSYEGVWSNGTSYVTNNIVSYTTGGLTLLFIATSIPPIGTAPTNTQYWRLLTIQGQPGESGDGLSYRQEWNNAVQYNVNDSVTYDGILWMALRVNRNIQPGTDSSYWQNVMKLEAATYPIQDTEPTNLQVGGLWFNTSNNPTKYYYLESLTNPAAANEIVYGQEAYDSLGNLIVGTLPVPASLAVTTNPDKMDYISGELFDPTGMVVTVTYTDGSKSVVTGYKYSPTGPLGAGADTIIIQYSEFGVTVQTTLSINIITIDPILNNNSWALIRAISDDGKGENYWSVGDTKTITINGAVGITTFSNLSVDAFILGFNHNSSREGANRIHFKIGKISGVHIALCDSNYGGSGSSASYFQMNASNTNSGGWNGSSMRKTLLGNSGTPNSPPTNALMTALSADLRAVMKGVTKYSDNTGGGSGHGSYVTPTTDYLFLLSEFEYHGARTYANSVEQNYQKQYDYYKAGNSKIHYKHNATGTAVVAWCRSVYSSNSSSFCRVSADGSASASAAYDSYGIAPCFCV